jgi:CheY-like chemotaxis protein
MIYVVGDDGRPGSLRFRRNRRFDVRITNAAAPLNRSLVGEADCFVIDYKMPAMSGIDLANRLRNRHADTPIILITGYPDENIQEKAAAAGIRHVLLKPHLEESLVSRIRGAIQEGPAAGP